MDDLYETTFEWPHSHPNNVIVTGSFDNWSSSVHLTKGPSGFKGTAKIPWNNKVIYKFIVDGQWLVDDGKPTEADTSGNVNNVLTAPSKPAPPPEPEVLTPSTTVENVNGVVPIKHEEVPIELPKTEALASVSSSDTPQAQEPISAPTETKTEALASVPSSDTPQIQEPTSTSAPTETSTEPVKAPESASEPASASVVPAEAETDNAKDAATPPVEPSTHVPVDTSAPVASATPTSPSADAHVPVDTPAPADLPTSPAEAKPAADASTHTPVALPSVPVNGAGDTEKINGDKSEALVDTTASTDTTAKDKEADTKTNGTSTPPVPSTPTKSKHSRSVSAIFPRSGSPSSDTSPTSSRFSSIRKKRNSIFGSIRLKGFFGGKDKDKEKEK